MTDRLPSRSVTEVEAPDGIAADERLSVPLGYEGDSEHVVVLAPGD